MGVIRGFSSSGILLAFWSPSVSSRFDEVFFRPFGAFLLAALIAVKLQNRHSPHIFYFFFSYLFKPYACCTPKMNLLTSLVVLFLAVSRRSIVDGQQFVHSFCSTSDTGTVPGQCRPGHLFINNFTVTI